MKEDNLNVFLENLNQLLISRVNGFPETKQLCDVES